MEIKKEHDDDSSEVSFVSRIPLEYIAKLSTASPDDSIQLEKANNDKKRKREQKDTKEPEQKAKTKGRRSSLKVSCQVCGLEVFQRSLNMHMKRAHGTYKCGFCVESFTDSTDYQQHNLYFHREIFQDFFRRNNASHLMQDLTNSIIHPDIEVFKL